jgi:hypothetical protein
VAVNIVKKLPSTATIFTVLRVLYKPQILAQECLAIAVRPFGTAWQRGTKLPLVRVVVTANDSKKKSTTATTDCAKPV